ncbi:unnamed protein product, partial [Heterosigma akashiwo]
MEIVFFRLHSRLVAAVTRILNKSLLRLIEFAVLLFALGLVAFQLFIHTRILNHTQAQRCLQAAFDSSNENVLGNHVVQIHVPKLIRNERVFLYSTKKAYLMLDQSARKEHRVRTAKVTVGSSQECFGPPIVHKLIERFMGYDTILMNWVISWRAASGFLYNVHSRELSDLSNAADFKKKIETPAAVITFKVWTAATTLFLFFTTSTLVSFTLRETQARMLKFTVLLQARVRAGRPYGPLVLSHMAESLVFVPVMIGILFFLFEFYADQLLAFEVLSVVWTCEVFSVVCLRSYASLRFFPPAFLLYFSLFHAYFFMFPFGFSYLALLTAALFLV